MQKIKRIIPWIISFTPLLAGAATVGSVIDNLQGILNALIPLLMVAAFVVFLWGVVKFILAGGDEEKRKSAKNFIIYGLIGLFVMVAVWGIIKLVAGTFGVQEGGDIDLPGIGTESTS
jgi:hypothetical protein